MASQTDTINHDGNNVPSSAVYVPSNTANSFPGGTGVTNLEGGTATQDGNNNYAAPARVELKSGTTVVALANNAGSSALNTNSGGSKTAPVVAAAAAAAIKATPGRLCKVMVTTLGTAALLFYDNASAASGTIIGAIAASAAVGTVSTFDMPAANGIWCASGTNTPAVTVSYD